MSTSATDIVQSYTGNASTTVFTFPAKFLDNDHLKVYLDGVAQTSGFTVSGGGSASGGSVTFTSAPASGVEVVIVNEPPLTQLLDLTFNGKMPSTSLENAYDKLTMLCQLLDKRTDQSLKFPIYDTANLPTDLTLANRQGKLLGFDTSSNAQVELVSRAQATYQSGDRMVFASVSALTTEASITSVSSGDVVLLTGYYVAGDFGSPIELIVEASTGGVKSHTLADGRYANLYADGPVNVKWFGAKGDSTHTPDFTNPNPTTAATYTAPDGTDDTQAFVDAFAASDHVYVPKSSGWYKIRAGIGSGGASIKVPDGGSLTGEGQIVVDTRQGEMSFPPTYSSRAFEWSGDALIEGLTFDGGGQYTPLDTGSATHYIYFVLFAPRSSGFSTDPSTSIFRNCKFYNMTGVGITGSLSGYKHSVVCDGNYFTDYGDHCFYFSNAENLTFVNNNIYASKVFDDWATGTAYVVGDKVTESEEVYQCASNHTSGTFATDLGAGKWTLVGERTSFRGAVKLREASSDMVVSNNHVYAPYVDASFVTLSPADSDTLQRIVISSNNGVCGRFINGDSARTTTAGELEELIIANNTISFLAYGILLGTFSSATSGKHIKILNNILKWDGSGGIGSPLLIQSGATSVKSGSEALLNRKVEELTISGNSLLSTFSSYLGGEFNSVRIENNFFGDGAASSTLIDINGLDICAPAESDFIFRNNTIEEGRYIFRARETAWSSITTFTYNFTIDSNKYLGTQDPIYPLYFDVAATEAKWDGTLDVRGTDLNIISVPDLNGAGTIDLYDEGTREKWFELTTAQVLALNSTPITLISAVSGHFIEVESILCFLDFNSAAYVGGNNVEFRINGAGGDKVSGDFPSASLNSGANAQYLCPQPSTPPTPLVNQPIIAVVPTADPTTGDSPLKIRIRYRLLKGAFA